MRIDDAKLVQCCLDGDTEAFGRLVDAYQGPVYATAYFYAGRHGAAEDIAQEAFFQAYRSLRRLRNPERFGPWMREITCRTAANWLRKHAARLQNETPLPHRRTVSIEDARHGPGARLERLEQYDRVRQAIDQLPERYRPVVVLRYLQELSYQEIGDFTGDSVDEVRAILQRAGRMLRSMLVGDESGKGRDSQQWPRARE
jgi:RNA polymerase sigma-70 factor (ECF subfamily)